MKIAIIAAMSKELALLLPLIDAPSVVTANGITFNRGNIGRHEVIASECGIGKVNAAVGTLTLIECFHPDIIINTGVAGGTGNGASILDVIIADRIAYHDVWCGPGTVAGQAAGCPAYFECPLPVSFLEGMDIRRGLVASGDIFVSRREEVDRILSVCPGAIAVDMESAAIAHVCHVKSVPFVCIRVISDTPGSTDNIAQYENFWNDAPAHTFATLKTLINRL
jgi:adenosylhomocysteine nucleosidase